ncbi:ribosomal RNA processing protein 36 homolog [Saccostrea echinata]|uniref:ribosomal RNA processing protein 36 homolog n=1 Tax=Saccostrea echinata TaxID=191078 RepID=UPI002A7EFE59|nr:ribosomal RNA processing protein 36 homolog [Saccostrea echinata]
MEKGNLLPEFHEKRVHNKKQCKKRKLRSKDHEKVKKTKLQKSAELGEEFLEKTEESLSEDNIQSGTNGTDSEEEEADEFAAIKKELSSLSFEELKKLKEKLGLKVFNRVLHGDRGGETTEKKVFKRANKNRPMEITSKRPVPRFKTTVPVKKKVTRDPRFDDLSGQFNEELFSRSYGFLDDIKHREREKVQKALGKEKDPDKKKELQFLLNRMKQQELTASRKDQQKTIEKDWKKKEQTRVKAGKTPFYLKKSEKRKLELAEKYKELQKSGKVEKYLGKKRKKTAQKEKKKLPVQAH